MSTHPDDTAAPPVPAEAPRPTPQTRTRPAQGRPAGILLLAVTMSRNARGPVRLAAAAAVAAAIAAVGLVVGLRADPVTNPLSEDGIVDLVGGLVLTLYAPLISLVYAAAVVGDLREDGTLVYLWLRPVARWRLAVAAAVAVWWRAAPLAVLAAAGTALLAGGDWQLVAAAGYAAALGCVAYAGLFSLAGLALRRALVWGLVYVVAWEGIVGTFGQVPARLAVTTYSTSLLANLTDTTLPTAGVGLAWAWVGPLVFAGVALGLSWWRLVRGEVA